MTNVPPPELSGRGTFFIFVKFKLKGMENFIAAIIVVVSLSVATFQVLRNFKYRELTERRHRLLPVVLYVESLLVICDLAAGGDGMAMHLVVDVMLALVPLMLLSSSLWTISRSITPVRVCIAFMALLAVYNILCMCSLAVLVPSCAYDCAVAILTMMLVALFMTGVWLRLREVKAVLQAGTVWANLAFVVDSLYVVAVLAELFLLMFADAVWLTCIVAVMLCATTAAYGIRISMDSVFVFYRRHERRIVESMKMSPVEVAGAGPREDDLFKDIYERILEYFKNEKPFLNGDLTINDIVSVVFTNKLYISRAISQYTGRNFCQFVNYHRIMYSVECFRRNPDLKVAELWPMCGFNTIVSYNMAFRLFMGENPSDWCRKEKIRISRKGK